MAKKRVYGFEDYTKKLQEGVEEIGFISEFEEENESIDDLGSGEKVSDESETEEEKTFEEETPVEDSTETLDTGNRENINAEDVKVKMNFVNDQVKSINNLLKNSDNVPIDKATKDKVMNLYNVLQGIS
jgi:hypothetical protein